MKIIALVVARFIEAALIICGICFIFLDSDLLLIAGWDFFAACYILARISRLRRNRKHVDAGGEESDEWLKRTLGRRIGTLFTVLTGFVGLSSGLLIALTKEDNGELYILFGVPAVLFAWAILHFGYAERYARAYMGALPKELLAFPDGHRPNYVDFVYFSFMLGLTFSVPDIETRSSGIRAWILSHCILSFIYNTTTIAIVVGLIT